MLTIVGYWIWYNVQCVSICKTVDAIVARLSPTFLHIFSNFLLQNLKLRVK